MKIKILGLTAALILARPLAPRTVFPVASSDPDKIVD